MEVKKEMMNDMAGFLLDASTATQEAGTGGTFVMLLVQLLPILLIFVVFYFLMIRPQKKKDKEVQQMRASIEVGDEVVTTGGIVGRVVSIKDDTVVIETGTDRSKIRIMRWSIHQNNTIHDAVEE